MSKEASPIIVMSLLLIFFISSIALSIIDNAYFFLLCGISSMIMLFEYLLSLKIQELQHDE